MTSGDTSDLEVCDFLEADRVRSFDSSRSTNLGDFDFLVRLCCLVAVADTSKVCIPSLPIPLPSRLDGDLDLVLPGVPTLSAPNTRLRASLATLSRSNSSCICSMMSNLSSAIISERLLTISNSVSAPVSAAFSDILGSGDIGTGGSKLNPSPRCVTWGLFLLTAGVPSVSEIFGVVRDVDVDELIINNTNVAISQK